MTHGNFITLEIMLLEFRDTHLITKELTLFFEYILLLHETPITIVDTFHIHALTITLNIKKLLFDK